MFLMKTRLKLGPSALHKYSKMLSNQTFLSYLVCANISTFTAVMMDWEIQGCYCL